MPPRRAERLLARGREGHRDLRLLRVLPFADRMPVRHSEEAERKRTVDHALRLYENPLKQVLYLLLNLAMSLFFVAAGFLFVAAGLVLIRSSKPTPVGLFVLALGLLSVVFFGLGGLVLLVSEVRRLLRPRPVLQVDAQGWTYTPARLDWTQYVAWQQISRVALQCQRVRPKRRFLLVLEEEHHSDTTPSDARRTTISPSPSPPSASVVMFVELNPLFLHASPGKLVRMLQRMRTEFAGELSRYGIAVADTIEDI